MRTLALNEPIEVIPNRAGFPEEFFWRRRRHKVNQVERWKSSTPDGNSGRFHLRTDLGLRCILKQDAMQGKWRLEKVLNGKVS